MPLTNAQKLSAKRHVNLQPFAIELDNIFGTINSDVDVLALLIAQLTACDNALAAIKTAEDSADNLMSGGGATFSYNGLIATRQSAYRRTQETLSVILYFPIIPPSVDMSNTTSGWLAV